MENRRLYELAIAGIKDEIHRFETSFYVIKDFDTDAKGIIADELTSKEEELKELEELFNFESGAYMNLPES